MRTNRFRRFFVSIHAPAWGATAGRPGRDCRGQVSIHAPAWGATARRRPNANQIRVSIHAPAWGATTPPCASGWSWPSFNPRTRVGCDFLKRLRYYLGKRFQSTHPRGVRRTTGEVLNKRIAFQSTHPRGVRRLLRKVFELIIVVSIHAPAWGATMDRMHDGGHKRSFNPRTRVGCDRTACRALL